MKIVVLFLLLCAQSSKLVFSQQVELIQNFGHSNRIKAIDVSSDNRFIISGDGDGYVKIWDFKLRRLLSTFQTFDASITQVKILGEQKLAFASCKNTVFKWNLSNGNLETKYVIDKGLVLDFELSEKR